MSNNMTHGKIIVITGGMFSGKSTEMLVRIRKYKHTDLKVLKVNHKSDERYAKNAIANHNKDTESSVSCRSLSELDEIKDKYNVIIIDEGQFFPGITNFAQEMADRGKTVIVAGLDTTFDRKPFGEMGDLMCIAEEVVKMKSICAYCKEDGGNCTRRKGVSTETVEVGGHDAYEAICRKCFVELENQQKNII